MEDEKGPAALVFLDPEGPVTNSMIGYTEEYDC